MKVLQEIALPQAESFYTELARRRGWHSALPGPGPGALPGQTGLPGHFGYRSDCGGSDRLRNKPSVLRETSMLAIRRPALGAAEHSAVRAE